MAIAYDNSGFFKDLSGATNTLSYTCSGPNGVLLVWLVAFDRSGSNGCNGVTFNGVTMTKIVELSGGENSNWLSFWYLHSPDTSGAHDIVADWTVSGLTKGGYFVAASYTGVTQTDSVDAFHTKNYSGVTNPSDSVTPALSNCWVAGCFITTQGISPYTASTGFHQRLNDSSGTQGVAILGDSNATVSAGSPYSMTVVSTLTQSPSSIIVSLSPFVAANDEGATQRSQHPYMNAYAPVPSWVAY